MDAASSGAEVVAAEVDSEKPTDAAPVEAPSAFVTLILEQLSDGPTQADGDDAAWGQQVLQALHGLIGKRAHHRCKLSGRHWNTARVEVLAGVRKAPVQGVRTVARCLRGISKTGSAGCSSEMSFYLPPLCALLKQSMACLPLKAVGAVLNGKNADGVVADAEVQKEEQQPGEDAVKYGPMLTELDGLVMEGVSVEPSPSCELRKAVGYMSALGRLGRRLPAASSPQAVALAACLPHHQDAERAARLFLLLRPSPPDLWRAMLSRLVHGKHWEQAQAVVRQCPKAMRRDLAIQLVQALRDERQYKSALITTGTYGLKEVFPDAKRLFREQDIREKVARGKYGIIEPLLAQQERSARELEHYRRYLLACLMEQRRFSAAYKLLQQYGYPDVAIDPSLLEAETVERAERYLTLPFPLSAVVMVDSLESLERARALVDQDDEQDAGRVGEVERDGGEEGAVQEEAVMPHRIVGVDVEWTASVLPAKKAWKPAAPAVSQGRAEEEAEEDEDEEEAQEEESDEEDESEMEPTLPDDVDAAVEDDEQEVVDDDEAAAGAGVAEPAVVVEAGAFMHKADGRASILQLGFRRFALLCDLYALGGEDQGLRQAFDEWVLGLLQDPGRVKVGFDVMSDFVTLRRGWPELRAFQATPRGVVDLRDLKQVADPRDKSGGLSDLSAKYLGKPLDKAEQLGNWNVRPLHDDQVTYAALDAYACVALFDRLVGSCRGWERVIKGTTDGEEADGGGGQGGQGGERGRRGWRGYRGGGKWNRKRRSGPRTGGPS